MSTDASLQPEERITAASEDRVVECAQACVCHTGMMRKCLTKELGAVSSPNDVLIYEGKCNRCGCVAPKIPRRNSVWVMNGGATMRTTEKEPVGCADGALNFKVYEEENDARQGRKN